MSDTALVKLFEHNNWANLLVIRACMALSGAELDAEPHSATKGTIRRTLVHLVNSQASYLRTLTLPLEQRRDRLEVAFEDLEASARASGDGLLALVKQEAASPVKARLETRDGYLAEPWVLFVQIINHATEHREQINSMLTALGHPPVDMDGWTFGLATQGLVQK